MLQGAVHTQGPRANAAQGKARRSPALNWLLALLISMVLAALAFKYVDVPLARRLNGIWGAPGTLAKGFASAVLLSFEAVVVLTLVVVRIVRGRLSPFYQAVALACLTSICAYASNDSALKLFFGVPNPAYVLQGARHTFHFLRGYSNSSFPSGHMVLAGSFAGVFMRLYRKSIPLFSALLLLAAVLLIAGDWHFVSDVIVGTFVGVSAGLLAGEVWLAHARQSARS